LIILSFYYFYQALPHQNKKTAGRCRRFKELVAPQDILVYGKRKLGENRELSLFSKM
jgi:hypothetical protein